MAKYADVIDLYDDNGKLLKSNVPLEKISPVVNPAIKSLVDNAKRTVAVNLGGVEAALKSGKIGKHTQILGRELNLDIAGNIDAIEAKIKQYVSVEEGDDTEIKRFNDGKLLLVKVPKARIEAAATYDASLLSVDAYRTFCVLEDVFCVVVTCCIVDCAELVGAVVEAVPVLSVCSAPLYFAESSHSWKEHVLEMVESADVLCPEVSLYSEDVLSLLSGHAVSIRLV